MQPQSRNHLVFFAAVMLLFGGYLAYRQFFAAPPDPDKQAAKDKDKDGDDKKPKDEAKPKGDALRYNLPTPTAAKDLEGLTLGSEDKESDYQLFVQLDPLGGGVRKVVLNKFRSADADGRPDDAQLELVPDRYNDYVSAFSMYHYSFDVPDADRPLETLGRETWQAVKHDGKAVVEREGGVQEIAFRQTVGPVTITKTYTLAPKSYHLGLRVHAHRAEAKKDAEDKDKRAIKFRYQLAGARGLPVEGKWYTSTFRNAHVCRIAPNGSPEREMQELRQISRRAGGDPVSKEEGKFIRFASVAVQYFASAIVVDDVQADGQDQRFLSHARPTLETVLVKGRLSSKQADRLVVSAGDGAWKETVYLPAGKLRDEGKELKEGEEVAVVCRMLPYDSRLQDCPRLAESIRHGGDAAASHDLWEDDVTVRVTTEGVDLEPGGSVTHAYLLYHGPVKPSLLRHLRGNGRIEQAVIDRYADTLDLNTMTDYPSRGFPNDIGYYTGFSRLVIFCTNVIHRVLGWMTSVIPSYGLCILLLTVLVRGMMFPLSRRQAMMSIKMQALAPEIKKLNEKYKDDSAAKGQATMELYRKHKVNPLGSCWVMLLQMPVFMGLWYALQESIQFRLADFWPTWIVNLAAPDMIVPWGRSIPVLSADASYGGFLYLGPYLNVLPIVAVGFMLMQQKLMTPPPADEQQEMQQKMMKYMMVVMCLMFYKVAAGLCVYFIASSLWGLAERMLLPKAKKPDATPEPPKADPVAADRPPSQAVTTSPGVTAKPNGVTGPKKGRNKKKDRVKDKPKEPEPSKTGLSQLRQRVSDWWNDVLESAKKK